MSEPEYQEEGLQDSSEFEPAPLAKVAQNIEKISANGSEALTVASKNLSDVLPLDFYAGASLLQVTDTEREVLQGYENAPDEDVEIRPEGQVYVEHMYCREALRKAFGPGGWVLRPGSGIYPERNGDKTLIFQRWVLFIRGCYVGEAIGSGAYWSNNKAQDKSDAAEAAKSNALVRICKDSLGIGTNPWRARFRREWRRKNAIQVWVKDYKGQTQKRWRRRDGDRLEDEIKLVEEDNSENAAGGKVPPSVKDTPRSAPQSQKESAAAESRLGGEARENERATSQEVTLPGQVLRPCEETHGLVPNWEEIEKRGGDIYLRCGRPSVAVVYHEKDKKSYAMCFEHADHNVRNRGGKLISTTIPELEPLRAVNPPGDSATVASGETTGTAQPPPEPLRGSELRSYVTGRKPQIVKPAPKQQTSSGVSHQGPWQIAPSGARNARSEAGDNPRASQAPSTTAGPQKVGETEWRYFMVLLRQKQLIRYSETTKGDDASMALAWLCDHLGCAVPEETGKTVVERMRGLFFRQSLAEYREKIIPALKNLEVTG